MRGSDRAILDESPLLKRKVEEVARLMRDLRLTLYYEKLKKEGEGTNAAIERAAERYCASVSTVKRALAKMSAPPWRRKNQLVPSLRRPSCHPARPGPKSRPVM